MNRLQAMGCKRSQHGVALVLVMWLIALLTALVGAFALSARIEHLQGQVMYRDVIGNQAARAGLEYAFARVRDADPRTQWLPDGRVYDWNFSGMPVQVRVTDESGKVDLNAAAPALLAELMGVLGTDPGQAGRLAGAIADWRDPDDMGQLVGAAEDPQYAAAGLPYGAKDAPIETVSELGLILGMPQALAARMSAHVTVHSGLPVPDQRYASGEVLQAMGIDAGPVLAQRDDPLAAMAGAAFVGQGSGTYSIDSRVRLPDGRQVRLRAVVRAGGASTPGATYTPLRWKEGASAPDDD